MDSLIEIEAQERAEIASAAKGVFTKDWARDRFAVFKEMSGCPACSGSGIVHFPLPAPTSIEVSNRPAEPVTMKTGWSFCSCIDGQEQACRERMRKRAFIQAEAAGCVAHGSKVAIPVGAVFIGADGQVHRIGASPADLTQPVYAKAVERAQQQMVDNMAGFAIEPADKPLDTRRHEDIPLKDWRDKIAGTWDMFRID